jgi:hypothetical protein
VKPEPKRPWFVAAFIVAAVASIGACLDWKYKWITLGFHYVAHEFYEFSLLAYLRRPSQLLLVRWHLTIGSVMAVAGLLAAPRLSRHGRLWLAIFGTGYAVRAVIWICGGNLPLVPGDSCHYVEVATSVLRGEGPVKHYVESYFRGYPSVLVGEGILDDWAPPLDAYVRAFFFRLAGLRPNSSFDSRIAAAKACSFVLNLMALPALYIFGRRRYGPDVGLWAMAVLAVLPVHAIYAGFILRESLVTLTAIVAIWSLTEVLHCASGRQALGWAVIAGAAGGLAVLARTTALAVLLGAGLVAIITHGRKRWASLLLAAVLAVAVCLPWALATYREYGSPFYSYTSFFEYNFTWTVHHHDKGNTLASEFYTRENLPEILRVKIKSLGTIALYSLMILGLPIAAGFCRRLHRSDGPGRHTDLLVATIYVVFVAATLKQIVEFTLVTQLGRYYLPVFALMLPGGVAGILEWLEAQHVGPSVTRWLAVVYCALVWSNPAWAYDATWLTKLHQAHWPALCEAGEWIAAHPEQVSPRARIMTWFPWELRITSDRWTILMPRNFSERRIKEVIREYSVTHILWGSFEPPPYFEVNPAEWRADLEALRLALRLTESREVYRTSGDLLFPLRLYRAPRTLDEIFGPRSVEP